MTSDFCTNASGACIVPYVLSTYTWFKQTHACAALLLCTCYTKVYSLQRKRYKNGVCVLLVLHH